MRRRSSSGLAKIVGCYLDPVLISHARTQHKKCGQHGLHVHQVELRVAALQHRLVSKQPAGKSKSFMQPCTLEPGLPRKLLNPASAGEPNELREKEQCPRFTEALFRATCLKGDELLLCLSKCCPDFTHRQQVLVPKLVPDMSTLLLENKFAAWTLLSSYAGSIPPEISVELCHLQLGSRAAEKHGYNTVQQFPPTTLEGSTTPVPLPQHF